LTPLLKKSPDLEDGLLQADNLKAKALASLARTTPKKDEGLAQKTQVLSRDEYLQEVQERLPPGVEIPEDCFGAICQLLVSRDMYRQRLERLWARSEARAAKQVSLTSEHKSVFLRLASHWHLGDDRLQRIPEDLIRSIVGLAETELAEYYARELEGKREELEYVPDATPWLPGEPEGDPTINARRALIAAAEVHRQRLSYAGCSSSHNVDGDPVLTVKVRTVPGTSLDYVALQRALRRTGPVKLVISSEVEVPDVLTNTVLQEAASKFAQMHHSSMKEEVEDGE